MSEDALFDVFDQDEPSVIVEPLPNATITQQTTTSTTTIIT